MSDACLNFGFNITTDGPSLAIKSLASVFVFTFHMRLPNLTMKVS